MTARQYIPGVPGAGHITGSGFWHPGRVDGCVKCEIPKLPRRVLAPSPPDNGPCQTCGHTAAQHWIGEPGGCEHGRCRCVTYRAQR